MSKEINNNFIVTLTAILLILGGIIFSMFLVVSYTRQTVSAQGTERIEIKR